MSDSYGSDILGELRQIKDILLRIEAKGNRL
jgi:hypothetical protein